MKRKIISFLTILCLTAALCSCGGNASSEPAAESSAAEEKAEETAESSAAEEKTEETVESSTEEEKAEETAEKSAAEEPAAEDDAKSETEDASESEAAESENTAEDNGKENSTGISFKTTDLDGNPVESADIFSENKITMVNLWGTYCGPCIREMPGLEELNQRLKEKDCAIIGVVIDVAGKNDTAQIGEAQAIIADTGVTYLNVVPWRDFYRSFEVEYIPTTYFIDSDGNILGEAAVGARGPDEYEALIDALLE